MKLDEERAKRLAVYFCRPRHERTDDVHLSMIRGLKSADCEVLTVLIGYADAESVRALRKCSDDVIARSDVGTEFSCMFDAFFYVGERALSEYDEIIFVQTDMIGPLHPFAHVFQEMAGRDIEVWSLTGSTDPERPQFDMGWVALRRSCFMDRCFRSFLLEHMAGDLVRGSADFQEGRLFTDYIRKRGHIFDVYCDLRGWEDLNDDVLLYLAPELVRDQGLPAVPRRLFRESYDVLIKNSCAETPAKLMEIMREETEYDTPSLVRSLLATENLPDLQRILHTSFFLPTEGANHESANPREFAVIVFAGKEYFERLAGRYREPLRTKHPFFFLDGDGLYAEKLEEAARLAEPYRYVCILGFDDYRLFDEPRSNDISLLYRDLKCLIPTEDFTANVCGLFEERQEIGMLIPPVPAFGNFFVRMQDGWNGHLDALKDCLEKAGAGGLNILQHTHPLFPAGGSFWIRTDLLKDLADRHLKNVVYADGNTGMGERIEKDALTRLMLPFLLQYEGSLAAGICSDTYAAVELTNQDFTFRKNNEAVFKRWMPDYYENEIRRIRGTWT